MKTYSLAVDSSFDPEPRAGLVLPVLAAVIVVCLTELGVGLYARMAADEARVQAVTMGDEIRARIERELNAVMFLTAGMRSYLIARGDALDPGELNALLREGFASSKHVRNFGIAEGTVIRYVYPLAGNESAVGVDYRDLPEQWPDVRRAIDERRAVLSHTVSLVQGGQAFVYRIPVFQSDGFWGLISAVVDVQSLFAAAFDGVGSNAFEFAVAERDPGGRTGAVLWGAREALADPDWTVEAPEYGWVIDVRPATEGGVTVSIWAWRLVGWLIAASAALLVHLRCLRSRRLADMALHDEVTGLPNRAMFLSRAARAFDELRGRGTSLASLLFCDIVEFHAIRSKLGQGGGDAVLSEVARRLEAAVTVADLVARWGNDEFVVLVTGRTRPEVERLISAIREAMEGPVMVDGEVFRLRLSIGVAHVEQDGWTPRNLIEIADERMRADQRAAPRARPVTGLLSR